MAKIKNPRFPHTCKIYRSVVSDSIKDTDVDVDDPNEDDPNIDDDPNVDEGSKEQTKEIVRYEGKCRSYDHDTTSDKGDVITSVRDLALPLTQEEWTEETVPHKGDWVEVDKLTFKEKGAVIDVRPNNLGTDVLWRLND